MEYLLILLAYLIGAIPMSLIVGKSTKGVDIRDYGSGNPGTTNAIRVLGRKLGLFVFLLDVLKGGFVIFLIRIGLFEAAEVFHPLLYGIAAAVGHIFPVFLKFKGGKAVATSVGAFLFYSPAVGVIGLLMYFVGLKLTRYVSVGSLTGAASVVILSYLIFFFGPEAGTNAVYLFGVGDDLFLPVLASIGVSLIFYRHRKNIVNIKNGTEPKSSFMQKK
jgi:glycerol-3-phosphate acyltransferase PlsY